MAYATAKSVNHSLIPVVDIGPLRDGSDPLAVARALHQASQDVGFIYISNHGIAPETLSAVRQTALDFFSGPPEIKESARITAKHRGWLSQGGARMGDDQKADLKESFVWGWQDSAGATPEDHSLRGANNWPAALPALETAAMRWFGEAHAVAAQLMRGFALGLDKPEDLFLAAGGQPMSRGSFVYYPPQPAEMGVDQFGVGPHTDFGVLTVLAQDDVGGLQVQTVEGDWIDAPPLADTLVVNVGDLLARWTNDSYISTPHRVVNSSGRERLSMVLAYDPEPLTMIDPRNVFGAEVETAYEPITCGDYLEWRFRKAFAYRTG